MVTIIFLDYKYFHIISRTEDFSIGFLKLKTTASDIEFFLGNGVRLMQLKHLLRLRVLGKIHPGKKLLGKMPSR